MTFVPATVTISIQDRPAPAGPSIAVSITPDPSSTPKDSYSPAVALWVILRAHIQALQTQKARHEKLQRETQRPQAQSKSRVASSKGRKPDRAPAKRPTRKVR